ncbi:MAG: hypothetical protein K2Y05_07820 [Hyphomicrobiaceae bacterium]|nr:hypothetical protein [Hyphomicrobiaceae bacterium]
MTDNRTTGYTVAYGRDEAPVPVYIATAVAAVLLTAAAWRAEPILGAIGLAVAGFAFYNLPLAEVGRPRMGANQYGIFIEGFGIVQWRAVDEIKLVEIAVRSWTLNELQIKLKQPLGKALIADWRKQPLLRRLMRLPWRMTHDNTIRISLDAFDTEPGDIERTFLRMWRHYRG